MDVFERLGIEPIINASGAVTRLGGARRVELRAARSAEGRLVSGEAATEATAGVDPAVCPHCGHPPDDFVDEDTIAG